MSDLIHSDSDPFCDCPACAAELEQMLQSSLLRTPPVVEAQWNANVAHRTARVWSAERTEARLAALEARVAQLEERIGA